MKNDQNEIVINKKKDSILSHDFGCIPDCRWVSKFKALPSPFRSSESFRALLHFISCRDQLSEHFLFISNFNSRYDALIERLMNRSGIGREEKHCNLIVKYL